MICWMKWGEIEKRKNEKLGKWERETDQEGRRTGKSESWVLKMGGRGVEWGLNIINRYFDSMPGSNSRDDSNEMVPENGEE